MISGLNHITFGVTDLDKSRFFYRDILGFDEVKVWDSGAYLEAGNLWLCLTLDQKAAGNLDYTHTAFDVSETEFIVLVKQIVQSGAVIWKENSSEGQSLYFCDPDGHRLELHVGSLASRLGSMRGLTGESSGCAI